MRYHVTAAAECIPPGEYDCFAAYYEYRPTPWYVASNPVGFDVAADGRATLPKVPGR